ncbi:MAG: amino acid permease [Phycisphaerales bacterium]|nr:amino acid permease [Phycisphaerales bacterium]
MSIFKLKSISSLDGQENESNNNDQFQDAQTIKLKRSFGPVSLLMLGVGGIIGAGLFSITGYAAGMYAGPAIIISFIIAGLGCLFAGLCYAELASMLPVAGSAYSYSYVTMGELIAWTIGWDLILEYAVACGTIAISWGRYFSKLLEHWGIHLPHQLNYCPSEGGIINLPAVLILLLISLILTRGNKQSDVFNTIIVLVKVSIVIIFITIGYQFVSHDNLTPFIPPNSGTFGHYGWTGILRAAGILFFAYIGFDAVSTAAQETKNPSRNLPIGIIGSLIICTILYIAFSYILVGVTNYKNFAGVDGIAPVSIAIDHFGSTHSFTWLKNGVVIAILFGYMSVMLVLLLGQSRIFYSMSKDGLLPQIFSKLSSKQQSPNRSILIITFFCVIIAGFVPADIIAELTSIGTLFAFILVCAGVWILRVKSPNLPRVFKTPFVPLIPILGILFCIAMMIGLPIETWIRLVGWMVIGYDIYMLYGMHRPSLEIDRFTKKDFKIIYLIIYALSSLLIFLSFINDYYKKTDFSTAEFVFFLCLGMIHFVIVGIKLLDKNYTNILRTGVILIGVGISFFLFAPTIILDTDAVNPQKWYLAFHFLGIALIPIGSIFISLGIPPISKKDH